MHARNAPNVQKNLLNVSSSLVAEIKTQQWMWRQEMFPVIWKTSCMNTQNITDSVVYVLQYISVEGCLPIDAMLLFIKR